MTIPLGVCYRHHHHLKVTTPACLTCYFDQKYSILMEQYAT